MKIFLHEIGTEETELSFKQDVPWVLEAVQRVDETSAEDQRHYATRNKSPRSVDAHFSLRKVDEVVVVNGTVDTHIELICSRCANPFSFSANLSFSALFCKDPVMAGVAHQGADGKPEGQNKGFARHAHNFGDVSEDLDITYLSNDFIELSDVLTEQLRLQIPFQPLCQGECKGICPECGADLNQGRCACSKIKKNNPFSVLSDFKVSG